MLFSFVFCWIWLLTRIFQQKKSKLLPTGRPSKVGWKNKSLSMPEYLTILSRLIELLYWWSSTLYSFSGVWGTFREVMVKEGVQGLFKGNGIQMIRIFFYAAIQFTAFEKYKKVCLELSSFSWLTHFSTTSSSMCLVIFFPYILFCTHFAVTFSFTVSEL